MTDTLNPGRAIGIYTGGDGGQLWDADHSTRLALEPSGDWCMYRGAQTWRSGTAGRGAVRAFMQPSGDLQLLDARNGVVWRTGTDGHPGAYALLQTDGNFVIYPRGQAPGSGSLWSTNTHERGGGALGAVTGAIGGAVSTIGGLVSDVGGLLGKVPLVGAGLEATYDLTFAAPFQVANAVVSGERIDRVALDALTRAVADAKAVAPYVQMVASYVPGLGTGLSAALGAGLALASGKGIDGALLAAVQSSLPGQPLSGRVFDVAAHAVASAVKGQSIGDVALSGIVAALPISDEAKTAVHAGLAVAATYAATGKLDAGALASDALNELRSQLPPGPALQAFDAARAVGNGAQLGDVVIQHATALLPPDVAGAMQTGLALGHAQGLQSVAAAAPRRKVVISLAGLHLRAPPPPPRKVIPLAGGRFLRPPAPAVSLNFGAGPTTINGARIALPGGDPLAIAAPRTAAPVSHASTGAKVALLGGGGVALAVVAARLLL